jgi:hypothetical protein
VWGTVWYAYYNDVNSFIPNHMVYALWIGSGALTVWQGLRRLGPVTPRLARAAPPGSGSGKAPGALQALFWSLAALLPLWMIWTHAPQVDVSDAWGLTRWGEAVITRLDIAPQATILADREKHPPLDYFGRVEGRRPDLDVVILGDEAAYLDRLAWDLARGKTVYLARFLPGLDGPYHLRSLGPLVEVGTKPAVEPGEIEGPAAWFGDQVRLLGYRGGTLTGLSPAGDGPSLEPGGSTDLTLYWQALSPVAGNYQVHLRLVSRGGEVWWSAADHPVSGLYPTAAWKPPEVVADWHEVPIPRTVPPGDYTLEVGLFPPFTQEGLRTSGEQIWLPLHTLQVAPLGSAPSIPQPLRAIAPGRWQILGYDLAAQAPPTGRVPLTLLWQPLAPLPDYEIGTRLTTSQGTGEWTWAGPFGGEYPSSQWPPGQAVLTRHLLTMPPQPGEVAVEVAVRLARPAGDGLWVPFFPRWLAGETMTLALPPLTVAGSPPAAPGTANYGDRILLLSTNLGQRTLSPGAPLQFTVRWQAIRDMEVDYTLFVQLLAPDGTLKGQIDVWPKDGTHPTGQWTVGEVIEDRYTVYVAPDAPPGQYQVLIGWYLLETMQRLPLLDETGTAIDDKLSLPALTVE